VRIGIHTGEPTVTDEGYVGIDVHRAARICAVAHGGQVVLSQATRAHLDGSSLRDLGLHRLKDLGAPERLFQLGEDDFPPLRSLNATNLPAQPGPLVGRERELAELAELIPDGPVVTLVGPGGSGKTRLALQAAAESVDEFADGVLWVPLATVTDPEVVEPTIAQTIGAQDGVAAHVDEKRMLLLLDNVEQLLPDVAARLAEIAERCPYRRLLITSRSPLRIAGEREYPVEPLPETDAVLLFRERAFLAEPDEAVREICRRLDGLPLAIELAAARTRLLPPDRLLARLELALPLLTGGRRDAPARQQTLRATIEWSYDLLSADEQRLFACLGVFAGSFTLEAAEAVCGARLDDVESLLEQSLLRRWSSGRLGMLETIREYAAERIEELAEREPLRRRLLEYLLGLAQPGDREIEGLSGEEVERLDAERDNFRGALAWALATDPLRCLELAIALGRFWVIRAYVEGYRWLTQALAEANAAPPALKAEGLLWAGSCRFFTGDYAGSAALSEEALSLFRRLGDRQRVADTLDRLAAQQLAVGRVEEARASTTESLALFEQLGDRRRTMYPLNKLAELERRDGRPEQARAALERSVALAREFGDVWWAAASLHGLADWALEEGDVPRAARLCGESTAMARELGDRRTLMYCAALLACIAVARCELAAAGRFWGALEALELESQTIDARDRARYAELVADAEGAEFSAAAEATRSLPPEDALDVVLEEAAGYALENDA
jgi:predicted ATPase